MIALIALLLFGVLSAVFASQNTTGMTLHFSSYVIQNVPTYLVILGSMLLGILVAWIISLVDSLSSLFTIIGKDRKIDATRQEAKNLEARVHELEIENTRLQTEREALPTVSLRDKIKSHLPMNP